MLVIPCVLNMARVSSQDFTLRIFTTSVRKMYPGADTRKYAYFYDLDGMDAMDKSITGGFAYPYKESVDNA